jgi:hypothetical protein
MTVSNRSLLTVGLIALLLTAVAYALVPSGEAAEYWPDGTPEASVHNYILAIKRRDLDRALTYILCSRGLRSEDKGDSIKEELDAAAARVSFAPVILPAQFTDADSVTVEVYEKRFYGSTQEMLFGVRNKPLTGLTSGMRTYIESVNTCGQYPCPGQSFEFLGPPNGYYRRSFRVWLDKMGGAWLITNSESYWVPCWGIPQ